MSLSVVNAAVVFAILKKYNNDADVIGLDTTFQPLL